MNRNNRNLWDILLECGAYQYSSRDKGWGHTIQMALESVKLIFFSSYAFLSCLFWRIFYCVPFTAGELTACLKLFSTYLNWLNTSLISSDRALLFDHARWLIWVARAFLSLTTFIYFFFFFLVFVFCSRVILTLVTQTYYSFCWQILHTIHEKLSWAK